MLCALVLGRSSEIIEEKVQLSIRTKSPTLSCCFSLKLAQSYFFPFLFTFVLKTIIYYKKLSIYFCKLLIYFYRQYVSPSVSFFACSYSSLNGEKSLSRAVWSLAGGAPLFATSRSGTGVGCFPCEAEHLKVFPTSPLIITT